MSWCNICEWALLFLTDAANPEEISSDSPETKKRRKERGSTSRTAWGWIYKRADKLSDFKKGSGLIKQPIVDAKRLQRSALWLAVECLDVSVLWNKVNRRVPRLSQPAGLWFHSFAGLEEATLPPLQPQFCISSFVDDAVLLQLDFKTKLAGVLTRWIYVTFNNLGCLTTFARFENDSLLNVLVTKLFVGRQRLRQHKFLDAKIVVSTSRVVVIVTC